MAEVLGSTKQKDLGRFVEPVLSILDDHEQPWQLLFQALVAVEKLLVMGGQVGFFFASFCFKTGNETNVFQNRP